MSVLSNLNKRLNAYSNNYQLTNEENDETLNKMKARLEIRGGLDQWTRMRQDKLRSLKKALLYSYQSAIVQKYNVQNNNIIEKINIIIVKLQQSQTLSAQEESFLDELEQEYSNLDREEQTTSQYIQQLNNVITLIDAEQPLFRCLINHDKLKVDYEDKIISIPFQEIPVGSTNITETDFHNGTVFKWVHGNKQEWTPDTYWIVYMQYSEETAYFRAEIRKADQEIEIITIDSQGNQNTTTYRGWMTGPNETTAIWNVKKGVAWNDLNYTKLLYITKDQNTLAFFQRFDRIIINGKPWQVQAYNESYSTSKSGNSQSGIIRVALKETYTSTDQFIEQVLQEKAAEEQSQAQYDNEHTEARVDGPTTVKPYDVVTFVAKNFETYSSENWTISNNDGLAKIQSISEDGTTATVEIITGTSNKEGFSINYGDSEDTILNVVIESL